MVCGINPNIDQDKYANEIRVVEECFDGVPSIHRINDKEIELNVSYTSRKEITDFEHRLNVKYNEMFAEFHLDASIQITFSRLKNITKSEDTTKQENPIVEEIVSSDPKTREFFFNGINNYPVRISVSDCEHIYGDYDNSFESELYEAVNNYTINNDTAWQKPHIHIETDIIKGTIFDHVLLEISDVHDEVPGDRDIKLYGFKWSKN